MSTGTKIRNDFPERLSGSYAERLAFAHAKQLDSDPGHRQRMRQLSKMAAAGQIRPDMSEERLRELLLG